MASRARIYAPISLILVINIVIGSMVVTDYGESRDESLRYDYAGRSMAAYTSGKRMNVDEKGPFYVMLARLGSEALVSVWGNLRPIEAWHFMHFISFLLGVFFLYQICRRFMNLGAALAAVLLFNTQPLLWGHAWINPKDIPFMAFFLGSVALGMQMTEQIEQGAAPASSGWREPNTGVAGYLALIRSGWRKGPPKRRTLLSGAALLAAAILLGLLVANAAIQGWIVGLITRAYSEGGASLLGRLFSRLAENTASIPAAQYAQKGQALFRRILVLYAACVPALWLACAALLFPEARRQFWQATVKPFLLDYLASVVQRRTLLAGLFLGFVSAIRALGPASGLLIAVYALAKSGRRSLPVLLAYFTIGGLVTYALWPGLWASPLQGYLRALGEASDFPWEGKVMFAGLDYPVSELPRSYLPVLLSLQFTEPVLLLFLAGLLGMRDFWRGKDRRPELALSVLWLFAPLLGVIGIKPTLYDNFRQVLFIVPPIFIFAGIGLEKILESLQRIMAASRQPFLQNGYAVAAGLILATILLPGLYWDMCLHPYQYVYYNRLVGGTSGAFRRYEMDYWTTSYREATEYLNVHAPAGSRIAVWGADHIVKRYARQDLEISDLNKADTPQDFAMISTRHDKDLELFPDEPIVFQIGRDGAIFTVVKRLGSQE